MIYIKIGELASSLQTAKHPWTTRDSLGSAYQPTRLALPLPQPLYLLKQNISRLSKVTRFLE